MPAAPRVEPIVLQEPACEVGCRTCLLECAVIPERLAWWDGEIERLYRERALAVDRRAYDEPLRIAEAASATLARRMTDSPRGRCLPATRPGHRRACGLARLH